MKPANRTSLSLLSGLLILLTSLAFSITTASAGITSGNSIMPSTITSEEISELLSLYRIDEEVKIENIEIKIFGQNDELVYSATVCHNIYECDERLNQFINQSDFITEVDGTKIYILKQ